MSDGGRRRRILRRQAARSFRRSRRRANRRVLDLPDYTSKIPYIVGRYYTIEEFKLLDMIGRNFLELKDPNNNELNCKFLGNKGRRKAPVKIDVGDKEVRIWATEGDKKLLHVFCALDLQRYLRTNNTSPFDRRVIVGVQFLTLDEIKEQEALIQPVLKTPERNNKVSPKIDPVDVLKKRIDTGGKGGKQEDRVLLLRIQNMRNLLKNPKLSKDNEKLYKDKLKEYETQIGDPLTSLLKQKYKELDNLKIQRMEVREKIRKYQSGELQWTTEQQEYYQDLLNSFPQMIREVINQISELEGQKDGASNLKKRRFKF